ncbi:MAG: hydroxylamine reductase [Elusimicrobia bacterium RIFOXYB2_FULL_49_7]|nr:MAG: hydroxylamine reductase [Elusimicrobia bacterium RIFOXYB2_FULL_49_7]
MSMFCRQCEQTGGGIGCTHAQGVCGKPAEVALLQDALIHNLKGISFYGNKLRELGVTERAMDGLVIEGLFVTLTNVNFDAAVIEKKIAQSQAMKEKAEKLFFAEYAKKQGKEYDKSALPAYALWKPAATRQELLIQAEKVGIMADPGLNEDIRSLHELILYGLKGMAAYADHAMILGESDESIPAFIYKGLAAIAENKLTADELLGLVMELGKVNLTTMEILDRAHNRHFGAPVPAQVPLSINKGPAIIVSGHDLLDLKQLLEQTEGKGISIYTHGEMLPAHGYPELHKHKHLAGHYGTAWQNQQKEFENVPAAILMTTNCIREPKSGYKDRIFTTGVVGWPGTEHIVAVNGKKDFSGVISKAISLGGFKEEIKETKTLMTGFGHKTVLGVADKVVGAVKSGALKHIFLIGGCDGMKPGRNYFTELAEKVPQDSIILTLACGKYRFNRLEFGTLGGLPRLLDMGQCNDAYSAIKVASALADVFKVSVNELPLSLVLSWYEQKAVCILITLLSLGIKNIRLGPSLPAFVSPNVLKILVDKFDIKPITTADKDLADILAAKPV